MLEDEPVNRLLVGGPSDGKRVVLKRDFPDHREIECPPIDWKVSLKPSKIPATMSVSYHIYLRTRLCYRDSLDGPTNSITVMRHESLTEADAWKRLVEHYHPPAEEKSR